MPNPWAPDTAGSNIREEGASEEDVNEVLWVEWMIAFVRLERWKEVVELLQEEMHRMVMFLEWKSWDWLAKVEVPRGNTTQDIESGLNAYARKQAAVYRNLAVSFATLWRPTLVSYGLKHSWVTDILTKNGAPPTGIDGPAVSKRGIFRFRLATKSRDGSSAAAPPPATTLPSTTTSPLTAAPPPMDPQFVAEVTLDESPILEEHDYSDDPEDSDTEDSDSDFEDDLDL